jgi:ATP-binding cassette subfamily C exporter for protease/lipase
MQAEASEKAGMIGAGDQVRAVSLQSLVLGFGALLVLDGKMTPGMMIAASILVGRTLATGAAGDRRVEELEQHPQRL